jgi:hypothetical protein
MVAHHKAVARFMFWPDDTPSRWREDPSAASLRAPSFSDW